MIILDNSVLSAFKRLNLLSHLKELISTAIISKEILEEYSEHWRRVFQIGLKSWNQAMISYWNHHQYL